MDYENIVIGALLRLSHSQNLDTAKKEWDYEGTVIDHGPIRDQDIKAHCTLCGHPIRYGFILKNRVNKVSIEVGSECINNYSLVEPGKNDLPRDVKKLKIEQQKEFDNKFRGAQFTVSHLRAELLEKIKNSKGIGSGALTKLNDDYKIISQSTNNEYALYKFLKNGAIDAIAKNHNHQFKREDYLSAFMEAYEKAPKNKIGWVKYC